jgi:hypothetical protein
MEKQVGQLREQVVEINKKIETLFNEMETQLNNGGVHD